MRFTFILLAFFMVPILGHNQTAPEPAPNFTVMSSPTTSHRLYEDFLNQGKTVVLELFFVDCPPCNAFAPFMNGLYDEWGHGEEDVEFIALNVRNTDNFMDVAAYQMKHEHDWLAISKEGESLEAIIPYTNGTYGMYLGTPTIVVIAPDGTVNYRPNGTNLDSLGYMQLDSAITATGAQHHVELEVPMPLEDIACSGTLPPREDIWTVSTSNCGTTYPTISSVDPYEEDICNGYTITYRWRSTGICGYRRDITTPLRVLPDTEPPVFNESPPSSLSSIRSGEPSPPQDSLTALDNCSSVIITHHVDTLGYSCCDAYTIAYRWVATDECGNSAEEKVSFVVRPSTVPPSFERDPTPIADIGCLDTLPTQETLTIAGGQCGVGTVTASIDDYVVDLCNGYTVTYRWTATNACGRTAERTVDIKVLPDTDGPVFDQEPMTLANISCNEAFPTQQTLTATDACGGPVTITPSVDEYADLCNGLVTVSYRWVAADSCGNITDKVVSFNVVDSLVVDAAPSIVDGIRTLDDEGIPNVDLVFSGGIDTTITTSANGQFLTPDLPDNGAFIVTPEKNSNILNGLTTFDLVIITKHILGTEPFSNAIQEVAADANKSNSVTTFDIVLLQQVILGIETTLPAGSWRFFPDALEFNSLRDLVDLAFTGVKIGDVNNSANPNELFHSSEPRSYANTIDLSVTEQTVKAGDIISVPFSLHNIAPLLGFQFTIDFDAAALQYEGIEEIAIPNFKATNMNTRQKERGQLAFSWFDVKERASDDLFTLVFKASQEGQLSDFLKLSSSLTMAEAYIANTEEIVNIDLDFTTAASPINSKLVLSPNPTGDGITNLKLSILKPQTLNIEILSTSGQLMTSMIYRGNTAGSQQISLPTNTLPSGVYFVSVKGQDGSMRYAKLVKE